jgi:hypothetical protein
MALPHHNRAYLRNLFLKVRGIRLRGESVRLKRSMRTLGGSVRLKRSKGRLRKVNFYARVAKKPSTGAKEST